MTKTVFFAALFLSCLIKANVLVVDQWSLINYKFCDNSKRGIMNRNQYSDKYEIEIENVFVNTQVVKRGQELKFKISAKLWRGELKNPSMLVEVYTSDNRPFTTFPIYELCKGFGLTCPIPEGSKTDIIIKQMIPKLPSNMITNPFVIKGRIEDSGETIECIEFVITVT